MFNYENLDMLSNSNKLPNSRKNKTKCLKYPKACPEFCLSRKQCKPSVSKEVPLCKLKVTKHAAKQAIHMPITEPEVAKSVNKTVAEPINKSDFIEQYESLNIKNYSQEHKRENKSFEECPNLNYKTAEHKRENKSFEECPNLNYKTTEEIEQRYDDIMSRIPGIIVPSEELDFNSNLLNIYFKRYYSEDNQRYDKSNFLSEELTLNNEYDFFGEFLDDIYTMNGRIMSKLDSMTNEMIEGHHQNCIYDFNIDELDDRYSCDTISNNEDFYLPSKWDDNVIYTLPRELCPTNCFASDMNSGRFGGIKSLVAKLHAIYFLVDKIYENREPRQKHKVKNKIKSNDRKSKPNKKIKKKSKGSLNEVIKDSDDLEYATQGNDDIKGPDQGSDVKDISAEDDTTLENQEDLEFETAPLIADDIIDEKCYAKSVYSTHFTQFQNEPVFPLIKPKDQNLKKSNDNDYYQPANDLHYSQLPHNLKIFSLNEPNESKKSSSSKLIILEPPKKS